ncbi:hypothetical protein [Kaistia sp. MMO-174]|uniref:hypothetical protein n=1 Tax=Kaistia sp. MMO-174 TaxID=3081256 RepID=UPI00301B309C
MTNTLDELFEDEATIADQKQSAFGEWLNTEMSAKGIRIQDLVARTGITYTGIWNIVKGNTASPKKETRDRLAAALNEAIPEAIQTEIAEQSMPIAGYDWVDFTPSDLETVPEQSGVYVFYDVTDRPVYVGKSSKNVRTRVKDHKTRFWFQAPLVVRGAFLAIPDPDMCLKIETVLIKFLGKHALLNSKGVIRDLDE